MFDTDMQRRPNRGAGDLRIIAAILWRSKRVLPARSLLLEHLCEHGYQQFVAEFAQMVVIVVKRPAVSLCLAAAVPAQVGQGIEYLHAAAVTRGVLCGPDKSMAPVVIGK